MTVERILVTIEPRGVHKQHVRVALVVDGVTRSIDTDVVMCIGELYTREGTHTLVRALRRELESWLV